MKSFNETNTGKVIETTELEDGRKSVVVHVDTIKVENPDAGDEAAAKIINEQVLPKLKDHTVTVTVIHKETLMSATVPAKLSQVRQIAEALVAGFPQPAQEMSEPNPKDFVVVEHDPETVLVRVTSLV